MTRADYVKIWRDVAREVFFLILLTLSKGVPFCFIHNTEDNFQAIRYISRGDLSSRLSRESHL